jgi:hypothetical protein
LADQALTTSIFFAEFVEKALHFTLFFTYFDLHEVFVIFSQLVHIILLHELFVRVKNLVFKGLVFRSEPLVL